MNPSMLEPGIFNYPRPKRSILPHASKKRKIEHKIEDISFDDNARADYLTGFHKRKVQRIKRAQEEAAKMAKQEKLETRKQLREERKQELEEHVAAVNRAVREAEGEFGKSDSDEDAWNGIEDEVAPEPIDHEQEYIDEDKYTTVTVEDVDVDKEGLHKVADGESDGSDEEAPKLVEVDKGKEKKQWPKKTRKQKFRYESKVERKMTRAKQKFGNKSKAEGRKGGS